MPSSLVGANYFKAGLRKVPFDNHKEAAIATRMQCMPNHFTFACVEKDPRNFCCLRKYTAILTQTGNLNNTYDL